MKEPFPKRNLFIAITLCAVITGLLYSWKLRWIGDDIFIAFRYVKNFLNGSGLVYNIGERVEGYTDFLWIMVVSFFSWLKCDEVFTVQVLGILSSLGTLILFSVIGYKTATRLHVFVVPFIVLALALNYDFNVWATSGLETSFFTFLLSSAFYVYFFSGLKQDGKLLVSGFFLCLALLTRPDTLLILLLVNGLLVTNHFIHGGSVMKLTRTILLFNLAIIGIYIPYFLWRYNYYGFVFPNTYYDKLGYEVFFKAGFYYIGLYLKCHFTSLLAFLLPPFVLVPVVWRKDGLMLSIREFLSDRLNVAFIVSLIVVCVYLIGFVAKVGGDFMFARFVVSMVPVIYFIIFYCLIKLFGNGKANILFVLILLLGFWETRIRLDMFKEFGRDGKEMLKVKRGIADERWVYLYYNRIEDQVKLGKAINTCFKGIDAKMLIGGGQACLGYYSDFRYCQEFYGLTDTLIAHSEIQTRGRIGHEKHGSIEYFQRKGINFSFYVDPMTDDEFRSALIHVPPYTFLTEIISYDAMLIAQLKARLDTGFEYVDFPSYLDDYIKNKLGGKSLEQVEADYENFRLYYFMHNPDKEREKVFVDVISNSEKK